MWSREKFVRVVIYCQELPPIIRMTTQQGGLVLYLLHLHLQKTYGHGIGYDLSWQAPIIKTKRPFEVKRQFQKFISPFSQDIWGKLYFQLVKCTSARSSNFMDLKSITKKVINSKKYYLIRIYVAIQ